MMRAEPPPLAIQVSGQFVPHYLRQLAMPSPIRLPAALRLTFREKDGNRFPR